MLMRVQIQLDQIAIRLDEITEMVEAATQPHTQDG
jgi:hypothetical protein